MTKKEIKYSFEKVLNAVEKLNCEQLHHSSKQRHEIGFLCPAEYELHKHCQVLRDYIKNNGL
jgi:uncharacterized protein YeaO (DUF488 family)